MNNLFEKYKSLSVNGELICLEQQKELLDLLAHELNLVPMEEPFEYVKNIQANFDDSKIKYSDEYYDTLGIKR